MASSPLDAVVGVEEEEEVENDEEGEEEGDEDDDEDDEEGEEEGDEEGEEETWSVQIAVLWRASRTVSACRSLTVILSL